MSNEQIILWVLGLVSAYFGIRWQASTRENESLKQKLSEKKEKLYGEWINFYMSLILSPEKKNKVPEKMQKFNELMLLTASNKVLLAYGDLMQSLYKTGGNEPKQTLWMIGELIVAMREDLGHKDFMNSIFWGDTVRPWMKDAEIFLPKNKRGLRRVYSKYNRPE